MTKPRLDGTLIKALARAWRWQQMLDDGVCASVSDIGDAEKHLEELRQQDPATLRLALQAPEIVDAILAGRTDQTPMLERLVRPFPAAWEAQRAELA